MSPKDTHIPPDSELVFEPEHSPTTPPDLRFLHYNDVYHVDASSAEPVGGIARFKTLVNHYRNHESFKGQPELLTFFSGDAFNPSLESSVTKGAHMVPILNSVGTDVACVGNHDLDFGIQQYRHLTSQCKFPWLLANVLDPALGPDVPLGNAGKTVMLTSSNGIKVGVIGLAEREWLDTINSLPPDIIYKSASETAKKLIPGLREQGAEIIVAVSHQREPNDNKLAEKCGSEYIDIILGGHDHYYSHSVINGTQVLRSGTDFKQLSHVEVWRKPEGKGWDFKITRRDVVSTIEEDKEALVTVDKLTRKLREKLDKPVGYTSAPLDARFTTVRTKESNIGNFVCDLMRYYYSAECCIMAAGTIRGDQIYPPGVLRLRDIVNCFPFEDPVVVLKVTGKQIWEALENGVSNYPALEGRYPQVSNIVFEVDYSKPPGSRIPKVDIGGEKLDEEREYVLATRGYMGRGKDGYTSLLIEEEGGTAKEIVTEENGVLISTILRQYFMSLKVLGRWTHWGPSMDKKFSNIQNRLSRSHTFHEASPPSPTALRKSSDLASGSANKVTLPHHPAVAKVRDQHKRDESPGAASDSEADPDTDEEDNVDEGLIKFSEREITVLRKAMRKWWRLAGLKGQPKCADELGDEELHVDWTKAIAPRVEGRIKEIKST
ncbi:5'-nucleotidase-like protein [Massarina eburnea CBS 473.64]|uniref:5'-nucleotidase-like protein n=1 Tax=Massarina eburnea CBS 473.64 TaxID=1395130 RepID=A0A6A6S687_9PLEO|nr:5'-nucleotidase-like protein [Massarina eburnea CBS 473.64]